MSVPFLVRWLVAKGCTFRRQFVAHRQPQSAERSAIFFSCRAPDNAKTKSKMIYASSKETFKKTVLPLPFDAGPNDFRLVIRVWSCA